MPDPAAQLSLFASTSLQLRDDDEGGIRYRPGLITPAEAAIWFAALRDTVAWRSERRLMYDNEVDVPRLVARFALHGEPVDPLLRAIVARITTQVRAPFNSMGLNYYRDGRDSVAPHHDKLHELVPGHPIALLSLGATRRMTIREQQPPRRAQRIDLEPGSLLVMSHRSQRETVHGIAKLAAPVGPRISVALRVRPQV